MVLPIQFESVIGEFDGAVWFRKVIDIPQNMEGKDLILSLGPIDDMDRTYFNGKLIGSNEESGFWQTERNYEISASLVKPGANLISVRVLDTQGNGGIYGSTEKMKLSLKNDPNIFVPLKGDWKYQPVAELTGGKFISMIFQKTSFSLRNDL